MTDDRKTNMANRPLRSMIAAGLCGFLLILGGAAPSHAQDEENEPPPSQGPLKSWYPRLSELPYSSSGEGAILILGVEYFDDQIQVSFFSDVAEEERDRALNSYPAYDVAQMEDGRTYKCSLVQKENLLAAVDLLNDLTQVQAARLIRSGDDGTSVTPTPGSGGPITSDGTGKGVESMRPGDVNRDGAWSVIDAVQTLRGVVGLSPLNPYASAQADINRSGDPDVGDAVFILGLALGLSLPPPYGYR
jgi:hypothetical protein